MDFYEEDSNLSVDDDIFLEPPSDYKVIFFNDDFTTKEFVVDVLIRIFHKKASEAVSIMESVHNTGYGIVGIYTYDIAATRIRMVLDEAKENKFPFKCTMEKA